MTKTKRPAIKTQGLTKYYGKTRGIEDLTLTVEPGEVFGFLGPNGAGKSTTINVLMGFRNPTRGTAEILGQATGPGATELRKHIGYMPGELALYENMTAHDLLEFFGNVHGKFDKDYVEELAERFELDLSKKIRDLSKGNKQKVALVAAWMHKPKVLILDEPTSGLDPLVQMEFQRLVRDAVRQGTTVFLSSHVLSEVEHLCHRVAVIKEGRLLAVERIAALHEHGLRHVEVHFATRPWKDVLDKIDGVHDAQVDGKVLRCTVQGGSMDKVVKLLAKHRVTNLSSEPASLEEFFFSEYGEKVEEAEEA